MSEFVVTNGYTDEPAFGWWVSKVMRKRAIFISKIKYFCRKGNIFKFGIEVPVTVEDVLISEKLNGNILWKDAANKETYNY